MPALATRFTGGTTESGSTGACAPLPRTAEPLELVSARLSGEFLTVPAEAVNRCVEDVRACAVHLGVEVTSSVIERIAREHLLALVNSTLLAGPSR